MTPHEITPAATPDGAAEPGRRAIPLGLGGLAAGIAAMAGLAVTVDGVPDAARLSTGQFLGDGSWSVRAADLAGLALHPAPGRHRNCRLSVRIRKIDKDMGDAVSIGAVYIDVDGDAGHASIAGTDGAISVRRKVTPPEQAAPTPVRRAATVTGANPVRALPSSAAPEPPSNDGKCDDSPPPNAAPTAPLQAINAPQPTDLGIAPPPVRDDVAPPTPAPAAPAQAHAAGIVPVRVAAGLRIGKFGKTGRPEEVVAVRGRGLNGLPTRPDSTGSIVIVGRLA